MNFLNHMKTAPTKLLTKIAILFLLIIVLAFCISATFLVINVNHHIKENVSHSFSHKKEQIIKNLHQGKTSQNIDNVKITKLNKNTKYPQKITVDSTMLDNYGTELHLYRLKKEIISINGIDYLLEMRKNIEDFTKLKTDVIKTLIPIFIIFAIVIIFISIYLSSYLFRPFYLILEQMKKFRVIEDFSFKVTKTTTKEFCIMQQLYIKMVEQVEDDYRKLKEYTENMAHEIQTPLAILRNKTDNLIEDENLMQSHSKTVKSINNEINHLSKLSSTLKLLTKIENNEYSNRKEILTKPVIEDHVEKLRELAGLKSIEIKLQLNPIHVIHLDPFLLEIILKNLLRNAILYSFQNSTITVETTKKTLTISNQGEASSIKSENLFKRFSKGNTNKSSLGLGLAIVKKICEINQLQIKYKYYNTQHTFTISN